MKKSLEILATPMDDSHYCRFTLGVENIVTKEVTFNHAPDKSFFVKDLFSVEGISQVIIDKNYLICKKNGDTPWQVLGKTIGNILRLNYSKNNLVIPSEFYSKSKASDKFIEKNNEFLKSDLGKKIQETIELQIQPSLGAHGGSVQLIDLREGSLMVSFSGGCQGCSQASVTVKDGIEKIITEKFQEVHTIVDMTNHSGGDNPYFK